MKRRLFEFDAGYDYPFLKNDSVNIADFLSKPAQFRALNRRIYNEQVYSAGLLWHGGGVITDPTVIGVGSAPTTTDLLGLRAKPQLKKKAAPPRPILLTPPPPTSPPPAAAAAEIPPKYAALNAYVVASMQDLSVLAAEYRAILTMFNSIDTLKDVQDRDNAVKVVASKFSNAEQRFSDNIVKMHAATNKSADEADALFREYVARLKSAPVDTQLTREQLGFKNLLGARDALRSRAVYLKAIADETSREIAEKIRRTLSQTPSAVEFDDDSATSFNAEDEVAHRPQRNRHKPDFFKARSRNN